jgi:hypothetical protein
VSWLAVWNNGTRAIRAGDVASVDPLRLLSPVGSPLLNPTIVVHSNDANRFAVSEADGRVGVQFEYLNPHDGAVVRVEQPTHANPRIVELRGSLIDAIGPVRRADPSSLASKVAEWAWLGYIVIALGVVPWVLLYLGWDLRSVFAILGVLALGDIGPAYASYRTSDVRMVVPRAFRDAAVGLPELEGYVRVR